MHCNSRRFWVCQSYISDKQRFTLVVELRTGVVSGSNSTLISSTVKKFFHALVSRSRCSPGAPCVRPYHTPQQSIVNSGCRLGTLVGQSIRRGNQNLASEHAQEPHQTLKDSCWTWISNTDFPSLF